MTSVSKIASTTDAQIKIDRVIFGRPTRAGIFVSIAGEAIPNVAHGDIYKWDGTSGVVLQAFSDAPSVIYAEGSSYRKNSGQWINLDLFAYFISAPIGSVSPGYVPPPYTSHIGLYVQLAGTPPAGTGIKLNDVFYWDGSKAWRYLDITMAPYSIRGVYYIWHKSLEYDSWTVDLPALTGILGSKPTASLASGLYTQVAGATIFGVSLGDIFYWSGQDGYANVICTYSAAPPTINIAGGACMKWANTWVPYSITLARALTSSPTTYTDSGTYTQIGGILPTGISYGDIFFWINGFATKWISYADAPDNIVVNGLDWYKSYGTWVPRTLSIDGVTSAPPGSFGLYIQQAGTLPSLVGGGSLAYGDIFCHVSFGYGSVPGTATRYLSYANAPDTVLVAGVVYAKTGNGSWSNIQQLRDGNRNYFPIQTQFVEGSAGKASNFTMAGNATIVDLAQTYGEGNLLRITTNKVAELSRFTIPTSYVRQTITITPDVDNTFFLKVLTENRWSVVHAWVCNSVGVPVARLHAQSNTDVGTYRRNGVNLTIDQSSACAYAYWEWFSYSIPKDVIAANLFSTNKLNIALCIDYRTSESFVYVDGWAVATNPFGLNYQNAYGLYYGLEAIDQTDTPFTWYGGSDRHCIGYVPQYQSINRFFISIPRIDSDIYLSMVTNTPCAFPKVTILTKTSSQSKLLGQPSASKMSAHRPKLGIYHVVGAIFISQADLRTFAYKMNANSAMWTLRLSLYNPYIGNFDIGSIFTEVA